MPERTVVAERLAERLAPGLATTVAERLLASPRLGQRARAWALAGRDMLESLPDADRALADRDADGLTQASAWAGAIWHAARVRGLIVAADLQGFLAAHGADARAAALAHGGLAPEDAPSSLPLIEAVGTDGKACLTAWLDQLPPEAASLVRLSLDPAQEGEPNDLHRAHGPGILRAIA